MTFQQASDRRDQLQNLARPERFELPTLSSEERGEACQGLPDGAERISAGLQIGRVSAPACHVLPAYCYMDCYTRQLSHCGSRRRLGRGRWWVTAAYVECRLGGMRAVEGQRF